jgi:hypothetical protein
VLGKHCWNEFTVRSTDNRGNRLGVTYDASLASLVFEYNYERHGDPKTREYYYRGYLREYERSYFDLDGWTEGLPRDHVLTTRQPYPRPVDCEVPALLKPYVTSKTNNTPYIEESKVPPVEPPAATADDFLASLMPADGVPAPPPVTVGPLMQAFNPENRNSNNTYGRCETASLPLRSSLSPGSLKPRPQDFILRDEPCMVPEALFDQRTSSRDGAKTLTSHIHPFDEIRSEDHPPHLSTVPVSN